MKKSTKRALVVLTILAIVASLFAITASAAYTPVAGGTYTFDKYLIVDEDANIPAVTFDFSITGGTGANGNTPSGTATVGSATFTDGQTAYETVQTGDNLDLPTGKKYAKTTVTIDLTDVTFPFMDTYSYTISETASTAPGITNDADADRTFDVYVIDDNGNLVIQSTILYAGTSFVDEDNDGNPDTKTVGYVNELATQNLEFGKEVTGNDGDKTKPFEFTLAITGANPNTTYTVVADGDGNASSFTTNANGAATYTCNLTDGQYVTVKGLPAGASYSLTEEADGYTSTEGIVAEEGKDGVAYSDSVSGTIANADVKTGYTNTQERIIPTGVLLTIAPFAIGLLLFGAIVVFIISKRRRLAYDA